MVSLGFGFFALTFCGLVSDLKFWWWSMLGWKHRNWGFKFIVEVMGFGRSGVEWKNLKICAQLYVGFLLICVSGFAVGLTNPSDGKANFLAFKFFISFGCWEKDGKWKNVKAIYFKFDFFFSWKRHILSLITTDNSNGRKNLLS